MNDLGLLGVGGGVIKPTWAGTPTQKKVMKEGTEEPSVPVSDEVQVRDQRLTVEGVQKLSYMIEGYQQTYDMASVPANTTENRDITVTSADKVRAGDYVLWLNAATLDHGLVAQVPGAVAPANDTIRIRVSNSTASPIDPGPMTYSFIIFRSITQE